MRFSIPGLILAVGFCSCVKTEAPQPLLKINEVSGKIRRIITAIPGSRTTSVATFAYDVAGRVKDYNTWTNDSTQTPLIIKSDYFTFFYTGNDPKPVSCTHTNNNGTVNEITNYTYDLHNRVIQEDVSNGSVLKLTNSYNYLTNAYARVCSYGTPFIPQTKDTVITDGSRNIIQMRTYSIITPGAPPLSVSVSYDNRKNPLGETNIGLFVKTFYGKDNTEFFLTPNNLTSQDGNINGVPYTTSLYYEYSTNGFPLKATFSDNLTAVFEYF